MVPSPQQNIDKSIKQLNIKILDYITLYKVFSSQKKCLSHINFHDFTARYEAEEALSKSDRTIQNPVAAMEQIHFSNRFVFLIYYLSSVSSRFLTESGDVFTLVATIQW
jgi:hypothetical protein